MIHPMVETLQTSARSFVESVMTGISVQSGDASHVAIHLETLREILIDTYLEGVLEFTMYGAEHRGIDIPETTADVKQDLSNLFQLIGERQAKTQKMFAAMRECIRQLSESPAAGNACVRMTATQSRPCKGCGEVIHFCTTRTGKPHPFNSDGTSHYSTCPNADTFRQAIQKEALSNQDTLFDFAPQIGPFRHDS